MLILGEATATAIIDAPVESVNVGKWMLTITPEEYVACSKELQSAAQGSLPSGKRFSVNLELAGDMLVVQHYIESVAERERVMGFSPDSVFWLSDTDYALAQVTREVAVERINEQSCELTCSAFSERENEAFVTTLHRALKASGDEKSPFKNISKKPPPYLRKTSNARQRSEYECEAEHLQGHGRAHYKYIETLFH